MDIKCLRRISKPKKGICIRGFFFKLIYETVGDETFIIIMIFNIDFPINNYCGQNLFVCLTLKTGPFVVESECTDCIILQSVMILLLMEKRVEPRVWGGLNCLKYSVYVPVFAIRWRKFCKLIDQRWAIMSLKNVWRSKGLTHHFGR